MSSRPEASIPQACGSTAEVKAAYRLIEREDLDWQRLLKPRWERSRERIASELVVLCIQDTTELNFNGHQVEGLGRLSYKAQRGLYVHPTYAVTRSRVPLGVAELVASIPQTRLVYVADREADMAALFDRAKMGGYVADLLVHIQHNRALDADGKRLFEALEQAPVLERCALIWQQAGGVKRGG